MISSTITEALAASHIQDMRRSADASRTAAAARAARKSTRANTLRGIAARLRRQARRTQLGPVHNYVTR